MRMALALFLLVLSGLIMTGCKREIRHSEVVHGETEQTLPASVNMEKVDGKTGEIQWLSRRTKKGIEWYPARITYDKQGRIISIIPIKQKTIPGTTSKIERRCHTNAIGDTTCELIKTIYDKNGNLLKKVILQRQRAIHRPLPGPKPVEIRHRKKNKN